MGPPSGHVRDPFSHRRSFEMEPATLLKAAGGTLPAIVKNEKGVYVLKEETAPHAPTAPAAKPVAAKLAATTAPAVSTAETKAPAPAEAQATAGQTDDVAATHLTSSRKSFRR